MRRKIISISLLMVASAIFVFTSCKSKEDKEAPEPTTEQLVQRGDYLVTIMGCHDCHSPKEITPTGTPLIPDLLLSGYQSANPAPAPDPSCIKNGYVVITMDLTTTAGPWGISYSANLTSDQTGIGNWELDNFKRALKEGKYKGMENGRTLLPPMPWMNFVNIHDEDVEAMFAYLKSTKPVNNVVPAPVPPNEMASLK